MIVRIGRFSELPHGDPAGPSLHASVDRIPVDERESVAAYLEGGEMLAATAGTMTYDVLDPGAPIIGPLSMRTDGALVWSSDLPHFVRRYGVDVGVAALERMRSRGFVAPVPTSAEMDLVLDALIPPV